LIGFEDQLHGGLGIPARPETKKDERQKAHA